MKLFLRSLALSAGFLLSAHGFAQTYTATPPDKACSVGTGARSNHWSDDGKACGTCND
ncbi:hypothetical protein ACFQAT_27475 [Undibacterium arcticum]|uniref:hypothetical protein n=1 Tax=Undibacterium arcticum TaxID=1762892 RepID=UPI00362332B8